MTEKSEFGLRVGDVRVLLVLFVCLVEEGRRAGGRAWFLSAMLCGCVSNCGQRLVYTYSER